MSDRSAIEWTDSTWNPTTGCTKVSPGCDNCYAERITNRFGGPGAFDTVILHPDRLSKPLHWRKPRRVFVNSMSDLFHKDVPDSFIAHTCAVMSLAPQHTFQVLTKRHGRMRSLLNDPDFEPMVRRIAHDMKYSYGQNDPRMDDQNYQAWPLPNVWLGVSVETQQWADVRIPALLDTPAAVRFLSCEPLLGPVELEFIHYFEPKCGGCSGLVSPAHEPTCGTEPGRHWGLDWVIVGGESGPGARPMHPDWARSLRDQCVAAGVPYLFKQWGEWAPATSYGPGVIGMESDSQFGSALRGVPIQRVGKHRAGRTLDGRTWDEYPQAVTR